MMYRDIRCEGADAIAPRGGCGCLSCYRAREYSLDPRLLSLANEKMRGFSMGSPAAHLIHQPIAEYLGGRLDYGMLHLTIIRRLLELSERQLIEQMQIVAMMPRSQAIADTPALVGADGQPKKVDAA